MSNGKTRLIDRALSAFIPAFITPNMLTAFRLVSFHVVVVLFLTHHRELGIVLFLLAELTDAFDGAVARTRNQISEWGTKYDPLADKLLVFTGTIFILLAYAPIWTVVVILGMETVILGGYLIFRKRVGLKIKPNACGKGKMVSLATGIVTLGLYGLTGTAALHSFGVLAIYIGIGLGLFSLTGYARSLRVLG